MLVNPAAVCDRFWSKVEIGSTQECWEWFASLDSSGYGQIGAEGKLRLAHRLAWFLTFGPIPSGVCVLHTCDNPKCCNPYHLRLGTQNDNIQDMMQKGRFRSAESEKTHCPQGHGYEGDNLAIDSRGGRVCRECSRAGNRRSQDKKQVRKGSTKLIDIIK